MVLTDSCLEQMSKNDLVMVSGWQEESALRLFPFIKMYNDLGITNVFCTDISKDGKLEGPAVELYHQVKIEFPSLNLIASGGVSGMNDLHALSASGCDGVIIGKAIYEGRITLKELETYIISHQL